MAVGVDYPVGGCGAFAVFFSLTFLLSISKLLDICLKGIDDA